MAATTISSLDNFFRFRPTDIGIFCLNSTKASFILVTLFFSRKLAALR